MAHNQHLPKSMIPRSVRTSVIKTCIVELITVSSIRCRWCWWA